MKVRRGVRADSVVGHLKLDPSVGLGQRHRDARPRACVPDGVLNRLQRAVVDRNLDAGGGSLDAVIVDPDRDRDRFREGFQSSGDATLPQDRRVDAVRELPQFLDGG